eukprot:7387311-Prymnesium_polylepis.2
MLADFLPANEGLPRRFPLRVWLRDYSADQLVSIYIHSLAVALSPTPPSAPTSSTTVQSYFTAPALAFLTDVLQSARERTVAGPLYPLLDRAFAAQAGAMVTLANTTAVLITSNRAYARIGLSDRGVDSWAIGVMDVYDILRTQLQQQLGPSVWTGVQEVRSIAQASGWLAAAGWQVPPSECGEGSAGERRRSERRRA